MEKLKIGDVVQISTDFTVFRDFNDNTYDICDNEGNCIRINRKFINLKTTNMKAMKNAVLNTAKQLCKANNTVTTLEIKTELRRDFPYYYWDQATVSNYMSQFAGDGVFNYTDNGTFRTYSLVKSVPTKTLATNTKTITKTINGNRIRGNKIDHNTAVNLVSKGNFVYLQLKNGNYIDKDIIRAQKKTPLSYVKRTKSISLIKIGKRIYNLI